jgi:hypothetical protein
MFTLRRPPSWAACVLVAVLGVASGTGCFGYNRSAKSAAYVGDSVLIVGGSGTIGAELLLGKDSCQGAGCVEPLSPVTGPLVLGTMLVTAGVVGLLLNLTRPLAKGAH